MLPSELLSPEQLSAKQLCCQLPEITAPVRILVVGDVMLDRYWFGDVSRISPEAPVPIVQVKHSDDRLGGAANVARNVAALGAQVTLVGVVGSDEAAACLRELLARDQIASQLQVDPCGSTTIKLRILSRRQQMLRVDFDVSHGRPSLLDTDQLLPLVNSHHAVVLSDYAKGCLAQPQRWISAARRRGLQVLVDPKDADFSRYAGATVLKPNMSEFIRAAGSSADDDELASKAQAMRQSLNVNTLLLTRSEEGISLFDSEGCHHFRAQVREVFDVCGAGDTVGAVMITLLAAGVQEKLAAWLANRAAGIAVARTGTSAVSMDDLIASLH